MGICVDGFWEKGLFAFQGERCEDVMIITILYIL